jgi:hypothetical protein
VGEEVDVPDGVRGPHLSVLPYSRSCLRARRILTTTHTELSTAETITATDCATLSAGISSHIATHLLEVGSSEATGDLICGGEVLLRLAVLCLHGD